MRNWRQTIRSASGLHEPKRARSGTDRRSGRSESEETMKTKVSLVLCIAVAAAMLRVTAFAESNAPSDTGRSPQLRYAVYEPSQGTAMFQLVDWDDHHRCDGDHDRDDRHCYWRDRDGDRYYHRGSGYVSNGYIASGPTYYA